MSSNAMSAFRPVPRTGVIYVTTAAVRRGYRQGDPDWCNLGQGQPETGDLDGAPDRVLQIPIQLDDQEYAPVPGIPELRAAVADMYNRLYRKGMPSQYSAENVAISSGGRAGLTRAAASLGQINLGHFLPDYTAYEELLDIFKAFTAIPILLEPERAYAFSTTDLRREIRGRGLGALLISNPCNPSGKLVRGDELAGWVAAARELDCSLLLDEFYSHYVWVKTPGELPVESAARYVEDVNKDPVVLFDGLTKNWRYPGWRVSWTVGPKAVIDAVVERWLVPRRRGQPRGTARRRGHARCRPCGCGNPRHLTTFRQQAREAARPSRAHRRALRSPTRGHILRVGPTR